MPKLKSVTKTPSLQLAPYLDKLYLGDCIARLESLPNDSVDLVCTDPPYGIGFRNKSWDVFADTAHGKAHKAQRHNQAFQNFVAASGRALLRVMKPGAFLFMAMTPRQDSLARAIVGLEDAGFNVGFTSLYWTYASGFPKTTNVWKSLGARGENAHTGRARDALKGAYSSFDPKPAVEVILVAMKPRVEATYTKQALANRKGVTWLDDCRIPTDAECDAQGGGRFPANLLVSDDCLGAYSRFFSLDAWKREALPFLIVPKPRPREKQLVTRDDPAGKYAYYVSPTYGASGNTHPTVKPLALMAYLIVLGSRPGDVVLDPFLGSGTTAVAAKLLGRRYVGIEREAKYLAIARERLKAASASLIPRVARAALTPSKS